MVAPATDPDRTPQTAGLTATRWLRRQPLVAPVIGLCIGIGLDARWHAPIALTVVVFALCGVAIWRTRSRHLVQLAGLTIAACCAGAVLHDGAFRHVTDHHIVHYLGDQPITARLTGRVVTAPEIREKSSGLINWNDEPPRTRFTVDAEALHSSNGPVAVSGLVAVNVHAPVPEVGIGQRITLTGRLYRPMTPSNPGERDWALAQQRRGILVQMTCRQAGHVVITDDTGGVQPAFARWRRRVRSAMLDHTYPDEMPGAGLLSAMVLGQRSAVDSDLNEAFVRTGVVHYLSVSGAHVGMIVGAIWIVGRLFGTTRRRFALFAALAATTYALLAEPRPAILRAVVMTDLLCLALLLRRPARSLNWVAMAALILILDPLQLFQPGFQMSFLTVAMLILLTPKVREIGRAGLFRLLRWDDPLLQPAIQQRLLPPESPWHRIYRVTNIVGWALATGVTAWLASLPLTIYHFQQVSLWGWLNTLLVMPLVWIILLLGLIKATVSLIVPSAGVLLGPMLSGLTDVLIGIVTRLSRMPGAGLATPSIGAWVALGTVVLMILWASREALRIPRRAVTAAAICFGLVVVGHLWPTRPRDTLRLHVLSVGNGSACVVELPGAGALVCDLGCIPTHDLYHWTVRPMLARERIYDVDTLVVSHANLDHYSAVPDLIRDKAVDGIMVPPHFDQSSSAARFLEWLDSMKTERRYAVRGDRLDNAGDAVIEVLWPPPLDQWPTDNANETSLVLRIEHHSHAILLCGDIEEKAQRMLLDGNTREKLRADVLLLPHHGSVTGTTAAFLEAVDPAICIRSSRYRNAETTNGLTELVEPEALYNTADCGAVSVDLTASGIDVRTFRACHDASGD